MATDEEILFEPETEKKDIKRIRKKFEGQMYLDPTYDPAFKALFDSEEALKDFLDGVLGLEGERKIKTLRFNFDLPHADGEVRDEWGIYSSHALKMMAEQKKVAVPVSEKNKYIFLSVPNFKKSVEEVNCSVDKWLYLLNHAKDGNELPNFGSEIIQNAIERIKVENASDELLAAQEANMTTKEDYESWTIGLVINASEKAKAEGHAAGRDSEREKIALDMLADNEPIEKVVKYSHLSEEKVLELREKLAKSVAK